MFDAHVFKSWSAILAGALVFGVLFSLVGAMSELVLGGEMRMSRQAASLAGLAFVGYIVVALLIRRQERGAGDGER